MANKFLRDKQFSNTHPDQIKTLAEANERELFYRLMHPDSDSAIIRETQRYLSSHVNDLDSGEGHSHLFSGQLTQLKDEIEVYQTANCIKTLPDNFSLRGAIRQYAPIALVELCWLQSISNASQSHTETSALLFQIYTGCLGYHSNSRKRDSIFKQVLVDLNIMLPATYTRLFAYHPGFIDVGLNAPVISLCLAKHPVNWLPEILGYTLAHVFNLSTILQLITLKAHSDPNIPDSLSRYLFDQKPINAKELTIQAVERYVQTLKPQSVSSFWSRLKCGFYLYIKAEAELANALLIDSPDIQTVWRESIKKEKQGSIDQTYSTDITVFGNQLNDWFTEEPLLAEKLVKDILSAENPDYQNVQMRRFFSDTSVFNEENLEQSDYLRLKQLDTKLRELEVPSKLTSRNNHPKGRIKNAGNGHSSTVIPHKENKNTSRQLYYELLNLETHPDCLEAAFDFVSKYLKKTRAIMHRIKPVHQRLIHFSHSGFDQQIQAIYNAEAKQIKPFVAPPKLSKEVYLWGIEQFAPVLLVDGSWLQNTTQAGNHHHLVSQFLLRIYADEIGDGRSDWNHANVYRCLLDNSNIQLPEFTTKEFSQHQGFINSAFDLPVFFLAISQFPSCFEAETIGLNLAIELSGLGSTYSRLVDELNYWEIDSTIVSLHLSIDNLATGHAALAHDAVTVYLDQILNQYGYTEMQQHWQRIWSGYLALQHVPDQFKKALIWNYLKRFGIRSFLNTKR